MDLLPLSVGDKDHQVNKLRSHQAPWLNWANVSYMMVIFEKFGLFVSKVVDEIRSDVEFLCCLVFYEEGPINHLDNLPYHPWIIEYHCV